jgi:hypothetical protein
VRALCAAVGRETAGPVPHFRGLPADDSLTPWSSSPSPGLFPATWPRPVLALAPIDPLIGHVR